MGKHSHQHMCVCAPGHGNAWVHVHPCTQTFLVCTAHFSFLECYPSTHRSLQLKGYAVTYLPVATPCTSGLLNMDARCFSLRVPNAAAIPSAHTHFATLAQLSFPIQHQSASVLAPSLNASALVWMLLTPQKPAAEGLRRDLPASLPGSTCWA